MGVLYDCYTNRPGIHAGWIERPAYYEDKMAGHAKSESDTELYE